MVAGVRFGPGEETDLRTRGAMLDEALELLGKVVERGAGAARRAVLLIPRRRRPRQPRHHVHDVPARTGAVATGADLGGRHLAESAAVLPCRPLGRRRAHHAGYRHGHLPLARRGPRHRRISSAKDVAATSLSTSSCAAIPPPTMRRSCTTTAMQPRRGGSKTSVRGRSVGSGTARGRSSR